MEATRPTRLGKPEAVPRRRAKLGRPRLLIVGCGDIGPRIVARLNDRLRIIALASAATVGGFSTGASSAKYTCLCCPIVAGALALEQEK